MQIINPVKTFLTFDELTERVSTNRIVLHHTAILGDMSAKDIHTSHLGIGYSGIGYHYVVRKNGAVESGRPIWAVGAHAFGCNSDSIGVCLSGNFEEELPTHYQIESTALLLANLCREFNLPINRKFILGHRQLNSTACPGKNVYNLMDTIVGKAAWYLRN